MTGNSIWTRVRHDRPPAAHLVFFYAGFILAAGFGQWLAIIPGISITLWPPNGVFIAALLLHRESAWPWLVATALLAELTCNALWFQNPVEFAIAYNAANAIESVVAAWLLRRFFPLPATFETLWQVVGFIVIGVVLAPSVAATIGSAIDASIGKHEFGTAWLFWWLGDATGVLIAAPLVMAISEAWRDGVRASAWEILEAVAIAAAMLVLGAWTLAGNLPFAYIVLPPVLWAAVRFEFKGAAATSAFLALAVAISTVAGLSPFSGDAESQTKLQMMMQLFLAVSAVLGLVIAAISRQRRMVLLTLQGANEELERRVEARTAELAAEQSFIKSVVATAPLTIYILDLDERRTVYASRHGDADLGYSLEEMREDGEHFLEQVLHPDHRHRIGALLARWDEVADEEVLEAELCLLHKDGSTVWRLVREKVFKRNADGTVHQVIGVSQDITGRKLAEEREHLLMLEVNHRAKNMLALVQAIARQTASRNPKDFARRFGERVQALAAGQDLLVKSGWQNVSLTELMGAQLAHVVDRQGPRVAFAGPEIRITAAAAQTIGMALHELATNAAKYGSLSNDTGRVAIAWKLDERETTGERRVVLCWTETGGPPVKPPAARGFGSTVIDDMVRMSLDGQVELEYAADGMRWRLTCPASQITGGAVSKPPSPHAVEQVAGRSDARRVLVVEDEPLIALEISSVLADAGFEVVGPAGSVAQALSLIQHRGCDAAVLDVNLGNETAEPIAQRLTSIGTPFITVSGYGQAQRPAAFLSAPHLGKPIRPDRLVAELVRCLERPAA